MSKIINEVGNKYGRLIVLERGPNKYDGSAKWICKCNCSKITVVSASSLRMGRTNSCGCLAKDILRERNKIDIPSGTKYGWLTIIKQSENKNGTRWNCKCDCGNLTIVRGTALRSGNTKSCGCLLKIKNSLPLGVASFNALIAIYKRNARKRGYKWGLNKEYFKILTKKSCYYCGSKPKQGDKYLYNGIDRLNNNEGYTKENVVSCCGICNYSKRDRSLKEFKDWIKDVYKMVERNNIR